MMDTQRVYSSPDDIYEEKRKIKQDLNKSAINSVNRQIYTARKLVNRQKKFPFHENLKIKEDVATAAVPGDSVFSQDASAEDFHRLAAKYPIIVHIMDKQPDDSVYPDVDPKRTPLSEYGASYGYDPRSNLETRSALKNLINPSEMNNVPETTQRYYHQNFNAAQWHKCPMRIPEDNLGTSLDTSSGKSAMNTEYMGTIGLTGSMIGKRECTMPSLIEKYCNLGS